MAYQICLLLVIRLFAPNSCNFWSFKRDFHIRDLNAEENILEIIESNKIPYQSCCYYHFSKTVFDRVKFIEAMSDYYKVAAMRR